MNGFHDTSGLLRQIEALSTAMDSIRRTQKALACSPVLEGVRRAQENTRRMQKALDCSPTLEGIRRTQETIRRMQKVLDCSPMLEGIRRSQENTRRMQKALNCSPMLEGIRRAQETIRRMQKVLDCSPMLEGIRRAQETIRSSNSLQHGRAVECLLHPASVLLRSSNSLQHGRAVEHLLHPANGLLRRMQKALDCSPMLEGIRRSQQALNNSSLALGRVIRQMARASALDFRVAHTANPLVAHVTEAVVTSEKAQGRDLRGRRLGEFGQTVTNWLVRFASRRKVRRPVGSSLRGVAEFVFSKKSYEQIYDPLLSDLRLEYCEALAANRRWKARWVRARGYGSFLTAGLAHAAASGGHLVVRVCRIIWAGG